MVLKDTSDLSTPYTIIVKLEPTTVYGITTFQENSFIDISIMDQLEEVSAGSGDDNSTLDNSTSGNSTSDNSTSSNSTSDNSTSSNSTSDNSTSKENSDS